MKKTKTKHTVTVNHKSYPYTLEQQNSQEVFVRCLDAKINQNFLLKDLPNLILDLPHLILAEKAYEQKTSQTIQLRVPAEMKVTIERQALTHGHNSISSYLREVIAEKVQ